jgi:glycosyltransferase involved in cell wall biosynthesis
MQPAQCEPGKVLEQAPRSSHGFDFTLRLVSCRHCHFVQSLEPLQGGGLGAAALQLHRALRGKGYASTVISTRAADSPATTDAEEFVRRGPRKAFYAAGLVRRARELAGDAGVVFHAHGFYVYPNAVFGFAARRHRRSLVCHPHGMFEPWILARSRGKKKLAHVLFENANFRWARLWRALTPVEADQIRQQGISARVEVIPNGIDLTPFDVPVEMPAVPQRTVLFLGRLHPKKGIDLLLKAWSRWSSRFPEWKLILAGPDEGGYRAEIERNISAGGIERVELPGVVTGAAKIALLKQAGVFALPSYSEGFPMAVLEALAARRPVLISRGCHFEAAVEAGAGWSCDATVESVEQMLHAALRADDAERDQRGHAGRNLVEQNFQWPALAKQLHEICETL